MTKSGTLACFAVAATFGVVCVLSLSAQNMPTGTVTNIIEMQDHGLCPTTSGFYTGSPAMTCYSAFLECPNTTSLPFYFGYSVPSGTSQGTIVFFAGNGGTQATTGPDNTFAQDYLSMGFTVAQVAWTSDWENAGAVQGGSFTNSILNAACRPATFLHFVRYGQTNPYFPPIWSGAGMCAQGISGGSGAIAYPLVYFGAGSYMDKVELEAGPPDANIERGCEYPITTPWPAMCPSGQSACYGWAAGGVSHTPAYDGGEETLFSMDTGTGLDPVTGAASCGDVRLTTDAWETTWDSQSIAPERSAGGDL